MEAHEVSELQESQEHGSESGLKRVSFTMSVLAVLLAMTTVLGHRTHTQAVLEQSRASDQWNLYQARKQRSVNAETVSEVLTAVQAPGAAGANAQKLAATQKTYAESENEKAKEEQSKAKEIEEKVDIAERRAGRFDLGEALLQIGVIVISITLLTRRQIYWHMGVFFGVVGILAASLAFLVH